MPALAGYDEHMNDAQTTILALRRLIHDFVERRDWQQFHAPKNLAMSLAIETAELMEHFQWLSVEESRAVTQHAEQLNAIGEELADVLCYALAMANTLGLDVTDIVTRKMEKNERKYPAHEYRGRWGAGDTRKDEG